MKVIVFSVISIIIVLMILLTQFSVYRIGEMYAFSGCVSLNDDEPIQGVTIFFYLEEGVREAHTDSQGCYLIKTDQSTPERIVAKKSGYEFYFLRDYLHRMDSNDFLGWKSNGEDVASGGLISVVMDEDLASVELTKNITINATSIASSSTEIQLSLIGGEVMRSDDGFPGVAPVSGYDSKVSFRAEKNISGSAYFKLDEVGAWGWLKFSYMPNSYEGKLFSVTSWSVNKSTSRWLLYPRDGAPNQQSVEK